MSSGRHSHYVQTNTLIYIIRNKNSDNCYLFKGSGLRDICYFLFLSFFKNLIHVGVLFVYMSVGHLSAWYLWKPEEGVGSLGADVQMVVSLHLRIDMVLGKKSQCSLPLSHLSSSETYCFHLFF